MDNADREKLRALYETNRRELFAYALVVARNAEAAEDAIHAAFVKLLAQRVAPKALRPYVFRCVRNAAIDARRRKRRDAETVFVPNGRADPATTLALQEAFDALRPKEREAVTLKLVSGLTLNEIAQMRRVSINTAASWYRRGIARLREHLEDSHEP